LLANALAARVTSAHSATPHALRNDPLIAAVVLVMLLALVFVFWRAVRAYDGARFPQEGVRAEGSRYACCACSNDPSREQ
jgi:hypothetical protein